MEHVDKLMQRAEREIAPCSKTSPTAAGRPDAMNAEKQPPVNSRSMPLTRYFRCSGVNYHNQFYAAYNDAETLNQAKRMWLQSLQHVDSSAILQRRQKYH